MKTLFFGLYSKRYSLDTTNVVVFFLQGYLGESYMKYRSSFDCIDSVPGSYNTCLLPYYYWRWNRDLHLVKQSYLENLAENNIFNCGKDLVLLLLINLQVSKKCCIIPYCFNFIFCMMLFAVSCPEYFGPFLPSIHRVFLTQSLSDMQNFLTYGACNALICALCYFCKKICFCPSMPFLPPLKITIFNLSISSYPGFYVWILVSK